MTRKPALLLPALAVGTLLAAPAARADELAITFDPAMPITISDSGLPTLFPVNATLTNTSLTSLYLNADNFNLDPPLTLDDTPFQDTFVFPTDANGNALPQPTLGSGQSVTFTLLDVTVPAGTADGTYSSPFEIQGGPTVNDYGLLGTATLSFVVSAGSPTPPPPYIPPPVLAVVPEPSPLPLAALGVLTLGLIARRRAARPA